ncbi:hypothetical protein BC828DRAFT_409241, partial [Blastocladiella britannica]
MTMGPFLPPEPSPPAMAAVSAIRAFGHAIGFPLPTIAAAQLVYHLASAKPRPISAPAPAPVPTAATGIATGPTDPTSGGDANTSTSNAPVVAQDKADAPSPAGAASASGSVSTPGTTTATDLPVPAPTTNTKPATLTVQNANPVDVAAAALALAGKVLDTPKRLRDLMPRIFAIANRSEREIDPDSERFAKWRAVVVILERDLLEAAQFRFNWPMPFEFLVAVAKKTL